MQSDQETRCATAVCSYLAEQTERQWRADSWLDLHNDNTRSPDVQLTDDADCIEMEITQLTPGESFWLHEGAVNSLYRRLAVDETRRFSLVLPPTVKLPLNRKLERQLKNGIRAAAEGLSVGSLANLRLQRRSIVKYYGPSSFN